MSDPINAAIGDESWIIAHGRAPTERASETGRIQTHLRHVLSALRARDVGALSLEVRTRRAAALAALAHYIERGVFPRRTNDAFAGRRPRFIDDRGVHCAVGELLARSGAPALAQAIDAAHEYAYVDELAAPELLQQRERRDLDRVLEEARRPF